MQNFVLRCAAMMLVNVFLIIVWVLCAWILSIGNEWVDLDDTWVFSSSSLSQISLHATSTYYTNGTPIVTLTSPVYTLTQRTQLFEKFTRTIRPDGKIQWVNFGPQYSLAFAKREEDELEIEYSKRLDSHLLEKAHAQLLLNKIMTGAWIT